MTRHPTLAQTFSARADTAQHPLARYLLRLMVAKASNLCFSADVPSARDLLRLADLLGPHIVVLKTHYDLVADWDYNPQSGTGAHLNALARKHGFLIFEDRKFADVASTVQAQYTAGSARIVEWAHLTTVNLDAGSDVVAAMAAAAKKWRERVNYEVKTSVSVGTPAFLDRDDSEYGFGEEVDDGDDERDSQRNSSQHNDHVSETGSSAHNRRKRPRDLALDDQPPADRLFHPAQDARKGSIVSVTTVTQSYEPVDSPRFPKHPRRAADADSHTDGAAADDAAAYDAAVFPDLEEAPLERGLLILAQMSSRGSLMTPDYARACVDAARRHRDFVVGFVAQESLNSDPADNFLHLSPGCKLPPPRGGRHRDKAGPFADPFGDSSDDAAPAGDGLGQQYKTPNKIISNAGSDIIIVGRGIIDAADPRAEADRYREKAWRAYLNRLE